ncbi:MAG: hypothetical protein IK990_04345 [Ruminiclostridium sp.]|nr:hypothetical protein [Ruminiclostridium sp.]
MKQIANDAIIGRNSHKYVDDVNSLFFIMLDEIIASIVDTKSKYFDDERRELLKVSCTEFYKNILVIEPERIKLTSIIKQADSIHDIIEKVKKRLLAYAGYRRIAELCYYKVCHRRFNKQLEIAFRSVVGSIIKDEASAAAMLNKRLSNKICRTTSRIVKHEVDKIYDSIYNNSMLDDKYKPSKPSYILVLNNTPSFFSEDKKLQTNKPSKPTIDDIITEYSHELEHEFQNEIFYSLDECFKEYRKKHCESSLNSSKSYKTYWKITVSPMAGYLYNDALKKKYKAHHKFILYTICDDLNSVIDYYHSTLSIPRKHTTIIGKHTSRFVFINSKEDCTNTRDTILVYLNILIARTSVLDIPFTGKDIYDPEEAEFIIFSLKGK